MTASAVAARRLSPCFEALAQVSAAVGAQGFAGVVRPAGSPPAAAWPVLLKGVKLLHWWTWPALFRVRVFQQKGANSL